MSSGLLALGTEVEVGADLRNEEGSSFSSGSKEEEKDSKPLELLHARQL